MSVVCIVSSGTWCRVGFKDRGRGVIGLRIGGWWHVCGIDGNNGDLRIGGGCGGRGRGDGGFRLDGRAWPNKLARGSRSVRKITRLSNNSSRLWFDGVSDKRIVDEMFSGVDRKSSKLKLGGSKKTIVKARHVVRCSA